MKSIIDVVAKHEDDGNIDFEMEWIDLGGES